MNENTSKINLKVGEIEISIEGPSEFVTKQYREMEKKLGIQQRLTPAASNKSKTQTGSKQTTRKRTAGRPKKSTSSKAATTTKKEESAQASQVNQWMKEVPKKLKNTDKALIAGYLNQLASGSNAFKVRDVSNTLKANNIKVSNPSNLMKNAEQSRKLIEQVAKDGRQAQYRFTKEGVEYVRKKFPGIGES